MHDPIILFIHVLIGSIGLIGGITSLVTVKGGKPHKIGGWIFIFGMLVSVITTLRFMADEFLPLAVVMCIATIYLMGSSITAIRNNKKWARVIDFLLLLFPLALFIFPLMSIVRTLPGVSMVTVGQSTISLTFLYCLIEDIKYLRSIPLSRNVVIARHLFRMILAFTFGVMAVIRIGVKVDIIDLEYSVIIPLIFGFIIAIRTKKQKINLPPS